MDELLFQEGEELPKKKKERFPDQHLQSPIRQCARKFFMSRFPDKAPKQFKTLISTSPVDKLIVRSDSEVTYGILLNVNQELTPEELRRGSDQYSTVYSEAREMVRDWSELINTPLTTPPCNLPDSVIRLYTLKLIWDNLRRSVHLLNGIDSTEWIHYNSRVPGAEKVYYSGQYTLLLIEGIWYLYDFEQILMLSDTIAGRCNTIIYHTLLPDNNQGKIHPEDLIELYSIYDSHLILRGNLGYQKVAKWETLIMACFLKSHDRLTFVGDFYDWFVSSLAEDNDWINKGLLELIMGKSFSPSQFSELHGLYRHWGHPTVDEESGCHKVKTIAQDRPIPNFFTLELMEGIMKRQFILSYLNKHGRWPAVFINPILKGRPIENLVKVQSRVINLHSSEYPLEDWAYLEFSKNFSFDYHVDFTELVEDTSIAPLREDIRSLYSRCLLPYSIPTPKTSRRVLTEILNRKDLDIEEICKIIMNRRVPINWLIVCIHAKERELKILARLFAMMVLEMRLYFCVLEKNIKETIFPYFPQQTMTLDDGELQKRLLNLSTDHSDEIQFLGPILGVDFSSWNLCWTDHSTRFLTRFLDHNFGTQGLYSYIHEFFSSVLVILASHFNPPLEILSSKSGDPVEGNKNWYNHLSGFEGLAQGLWTLATLALVILAGHQVGIRTYVAEQGDNLIVKLILPIPSGYDNPIQYFEMNRELVVNRIRGFISCLSKLAQSIGLHIKEQETWVALDTLSYGKDIYFRGVALPQGSKRISRLMAGVNEIFPTTATNLSSLQTAADATSVKTFEPTIPFLMGLIECYSSLYSHVRIMISRKLLGKELFSMIKERGFIKFFFLMNTEIFGVPILNLLDSTYRGHPDPLSSYVTFISQMSKKWNIAKQLWFRLCFHIFERGMASSELLLTNPCSVNIKKPISIASIFRSSVENMLRGNVKNQYLREIFGRSASRKDKKFSDSLVRTTPLHPRILHEIFSSSELGFKLSFVAKFSNTRTTQGSINKSKRSISQLIDDTEAELINYLFDQYHQTRKQILPQRLLLDYCPTQVTQGLRNWSWKPLIEDEPIQGVTIPHPSHQFTLINTHKMTDHSNCLPISSEEYILFMVPGCNQEKLQVERGPYPLYLGSRTREKIGGKIFKIAKTSRPLKSAERFILIRSWVAQYGSDWFDFLTKLAVSRTNLPLNVLEQCSGYILGGSVVHRLDDHLTKKSTHPNLRPNTSSHVYFSSDLMGKFSRGQDNYNLHYQGVIQYSLWQIHNFLLHSSDLIDTTFHAHYSGMCCEEQLPDVIIDFKEETLIPEIEIRLKNPLIYADFQNMPSLRQPKTDSLLSYTKSNNSGLAIGAILFRKWFSLGNLYNFGVSDVSNPGMTSIGIPEILEAGVRNILEGFALYVFFYIPRKKLSESANYLLIDDHVFREIAPFCVLPEIATEILLLNGNWVPPGFSLSLQVITGILKVIVVKMLRDLITEKDSVRQYCQKMIFFKGAQIGTFRILHMWGNLVDHFYQGSVDIQSMIKQVSHLSPSLEYESFDLGIIDSLEQCISNKYGVQLLSQLRQEVPLRVSEVPPETICRNARKLKRIQTAVPMREVVLGKNKTFLESPFVGSISFGTYARLFEVPLILNSMTMEALDIPFSNYQYSSGKSREDQKYRLFGNTSTSFLKVIEILKRENVKLRGDVITLAEGEGSIAKLLVSLGARNVYYNSLIDRSKLIPQRGQYFLPSNLIEFRESTKMADFCALSGGDLSCLSVIDGILKIIPRSGVDMVTCDAEVSMSKNPILANKILLAWLMVCIRSSSKTALIKTFCHDEYCLEKYIATARVAYSQIKVITPNYCSHENYEVYIYCQSPIADISILDQVRSAYISNLTIYQQSARGLISMLKILRDERPSYKPFLDFNVDLAFNLLRESEKCGFLDNSLSCYEYLVGSIPITEGKDLKIRILLDKSYMELMSKMRSLLGTYQSGLSANLGRVVETDLPVVEKTKVIHKSLDQLCLNLINLELIKRIYKLGEESRVHEVLQLESVYQYKYQLDDFKYPYSITPEDWRSRFSKTIWRLWGHSNYSGNHACLIKW